jgi:hypothetical protein
VTAQVRNILESFDLLADDDKRELATEIIRRSQSLALPPLADDQLIGIADEVFVELDRGEAAHA